jgi:hypothetical protein
MIWVRAMSLACCAIALALAGACGGGEEAGDPQPVATEAASAKPDADRKTAAQRSKRTLRLLENGNPTVFVKVRETVDLYDKPGGKVVENVGHFTEFGSRTVYAVTDQKGEWAAVLTPFTENGEPLWLELDPKRLKAGRTVWDVEVDLSEFETRVYESGKLVREFPVSIGMPTAPTPTGRFAITDTFRGDLNAAYGCCALAITARQINLPSGWLGGDRIAFHGTSGEIGAEISHGCLRAADEDVSALVDMVPPGTPVEIHG